MHAGAIGRQRLDEMQAGPLRDLLRGVALGARLREAERVDGGLRIVPRHQLVDGTMAGLAGGLARDLGENGLAVHRGGEGVDGVLVAGGAVGPGAGGVVLLVDGSRVAIGAGERAVHRLFKRCRIDVVTVGAGGLLGPCGRNGPRQPQKAGCREGPESVAAREDSLQPGSHVRTLPRASRSSLLQAAEDLRILLPYGQQAVTERAVLRDRSAVRGLMRVVVAAEAAGRVLVSDMVGV